MKLRNKKTGEIGELQITEKHCAVAVGNGTASCGIEIYSSLAELNSEWEDAPEEPKESYFIDSQGYVQIWRDESCDDWSKEKSIGNYFKTKEEAELAVEKLKAWKRLRDKGFKFFGVKGLDYAIDFEVNPPYTHITFDEYTATEDQKEFYDDLMLLFGGEE